MRSRICHSALLLLGLYTIGCVEPYTIDGVAVNPDFLVVDGFVDASAGTCTVRLSRAVGLNNEQPLWAEAGATVWLESEAGTSITLSEVVDELPEKGGGLYLAEGISVIGEEYYTLHITLSNGRQYKSDLVRIERAAKIESLGWTSGADVVAIRVSTVPNTSSTQFYRWRFTESWQYNSPRSSNLIIRDGRPQPRAPEERIFTCYREDPSYSILIGSSQNLSVNVMRNYVVQSIPTNSIKLSTRYNLRVQQYALSEEAYTFWLNLYKTTESTGGLFDPMPGQVTGNIRNVTDPSEVVVGYFSGSTVEESSTWIERSDFPSGYIDYRPPFCAPDTLEVSQVFGLPEGTPLVEAVYGPTGAITGYMTASPSCIDCRIYGGGTTTKPDFWP